MTAEPLDLAALRTLAEKATPGPWHVEGDEYGGDIYGADRDAEYIAVDHEGLQPCIRFRPNAEYIAAFSPDRALALLSEVESLRAALRDAYGMLPPERVGLLREPTHDAMTRARAATEPTEREARTVSTKFAFYCSCGGAMTGAVEPSEIPTLEAAFWTVHAGSGHAPTTREKAAYARRRAEREAE